LANQRLIYRSPKRLLDVVSLKMTDDRGVALSPSSIYKEVNRYGH
jgi:hypothetical protein